MGDFGYFIVFIISIIAGIFFGFGLVSLYIDFRIKSVTDNIYRLDMAKFYYGENWYKALKECNEAHIGDECLLCSPTSKQNIKIGE